MARADATRRPELDELREHVAELERERELLNAIANTAPSLLCLIDPDGTVRPAATNKAFERRLDYAPGKTGGVLFWERYVPPEDAGRVRAAIEAVVDGGEPAFHEGRWLTRAGEVVHVEWSCSPLPMISSGPLFLLSAADVTERKRHEAEVRDSRARIVAAADEARKRLERNLHDGAQQRLVAVLLALRLARGRVSAVPDATEALDAAITELSAAVAELRELARGIHPAALTERGLATAVRGLAQRTPVPVELDVTDVRYPEPVEAAAYFVVSESLANVARYARASGASVRIREEGGALAVEVEDDGVGGADQSAGTGLSGLADRVAALDGSFAVESPPGDGNGCGRRSRFASSATRQVPESLREVLLVRVPLDVAEVGRRDDVRQRQQLVPDRRLLVEHVDGRERRPPLRECRGERTWLDEAGASGVDEERPPGIAARSSRVTSCASPASAGRGR